MRAARILSLARSTPPAVVLQSSYANGLGIIRGLGSQGVPVIALDTDPRALGFRSRYAAGMLCPDPRRDEEAFIVFLEGLGRRLPQRAVVFPTHDEYIWAVARNAERLDPWYAIPFSRWDAMRHLADKEEQLRAAWRVGVDTPRTEFVRSAADLAAAAADFAFPAIFKPVESLAFKERFARPVLRIETRAELEQVYERVRRLRHAHAPGDRARRRRRALERRLVPRRALRAARRLHGTQAAPASPPVRHSAFRRERLDARARRRRRPPAQGASLSRRLAGRVQARPPRRALQADGGQCPALAVAIPSPRPAA